MKTVTTCGLALTAVLLLTVPSLMAHAPSGAIFTTVVDGSEVNYNHYPSKEAVYLDGGPGVGAPQDAAGLDDGTYVFQVTDPPGKKLLSTDPAGCRQFTVSGGVITEVVAQPDRCEHSVGNDIDHPPAKTVQLVPYLDTPNPGGVYKAWVVEVNDYLAACAALGVANGLDVVDCGFKPKNAHGFIPSHSKTDNFKVKKVPIVEIDTRFIDESTGQPMDGLQIEWSDPLGASNVKWSYFNPALDVIHQAHVEGVEDGYHKITVEDQPGCLVHDIFLTEFRSGGRVGPRQWVGAGQGTVTVPVSARGKALTIFVDVDCHTN